MTAPTPIRTKISHEDDALRRRNGGPTELSGREMRQFHEARQIAKLPLSAKVIDEAVNCIAFLSPRFKVLRSDRGFFLYNWTIFDKRGRKIVDVAYGPYAYGFPDRVEIMGLLLPSELKDDEVISISLSDLIERVSLYCSHPTLFVPMWRLRSVKKRE